MKGSSPGGPLVTSQGCGKDSTNNPKLCWILSSGTKCWSFTISSSISQQTELSLLLLPYFKAVLGEISTSAHGTEKCVTSTKCLQSQGH